jgi:cobalt-zinc-cadmium efflux system membrane fusion protein
VKRIFLLLTLFCLLTGCRKEAAPPKTPEGPKPVSVTRWTEKTELFMEHPPLVAADKARFAVHFTDLRTFKPVARGHVVVQLVNAGGATEVFATDAPSRPGIFGVDVSPKSAGTYSMAVQLSSPDLQDLHALGSVTVYADAALAGAVPAEQKGESISFLKEQQWAMEFATETAKERTLRESFKVPGEIRPRTGGEAEVTAPIGGRLSTSHLPAAIGTLVTKGQALAALVPRTANAADRASLELAVSEATTALGLARKDLDRVERLLAAGAIPAKRMEEAKGRESTEAARLAAAQRSLDQYETNRQAEGEPGKDTLFLLRSPISGVVAESHATAGAGVEEGQSLYKIVAVDAVYAVANVPESEAARLRQISGAEVEVPGVDEPLVLGNAISIGRIVDPGSRNLNVIYAVNNSKRLLAVGQSVFIRLYTSATLKATAVPRSAVVDDGGRPVVFVQVSGESFERRAVRLGNQDAGYLQVVDGIKPAERVVTQGAYLIRLATLSPQIPAHGHVH